MRIDQFAGRTNEELAAMARARGLQVPAEAQDGQLRRLLRRHREECHVDSGYGILASRQHRQPVDDARLARIDAEVTAVLSDGSMWTVRGLRAATMRSGEEVRASLLRIGARGDGTGVFRLPGAPVAGRNGTAAS